MLGLYWGQVVQHQHDLVGVRELLIHQRLDHLSKIYARAPLRDLNVPPAQERGTHHNRSGALTLNRLAVPLRLYSLSWRAGLPVPRDRGERTSERSCLLASSRQTRGASRRGPLVHVQHVLHAEDELSNLLRQDAPAFL